MKTSKSGQNEPKRCFFPLKTSKIENLFSDMTWSASDLQPQTAPSTSLGFFCAQNLRPGLLESEANGARKWRDCGTNRRSVSTTRLRESTGRNFIPSLLCHRTHTLTRTHTHSRSELTFTLYLCLT